MKQKKLRKYIFITSLVITLVIFALGLLLSYGLDFARINHITRIMQDHEISSRAYKMEMDFIDTFGGDKCDLMIDKIDELKSEIAQVGQDLSNYGGKSFFKKNDFDYLKRKYFLLEMKFYVLVKDFNIECGKSYVSVIFFYEIDNDDSERQGYVLDDIGQSMRDKAVILSFDKDYDDEPALDILKNKYGVEEAPTIIIEDIIIDRFAYTGEINNTILDVLYDRGVDKYAPDLSYVFDANGVDIYNYVAELDVLMKNVSDSFAKADMLLVKGRLLNDSDIICSSLKYYDNVSDENIFRKALAYESIASIGCGRNKKAFYLEASDLWKSIGNSFRAEVDRKLAYQMDMDFHLAEYGLFDELYYEPEKDEFVLGDDYFVIEDETLVSQVDRVTRDWLGLQFADPYSEDILTVFSERLTYNESELQSEIGWHEGARIKDLGLTPHTAAGILVKKFDGVWYASNLKGKFMFEVPLDKVKYPTTRFLKEDLAVIVDSHGINMLVERAELLNASLVIGCCDNIDKIRAAKYLSEEGIKTICFTDKYLPLVMNQRLSILGSPPIKKEGGNIVVGNQTIVIDAYDKILAMDVSSYKHAISYYSTPALYFKVFSELYPKFDIAYFSITDFYQMDKFIGYAELIDADVIGVRVFNSDDYKYVKRWLEKDNSNRAILFHSSSYPYGIKILEEFPEQTTFDDINIE